jgi:hypothetical protein
MTPTSVVVTLFHDYAATKKHQRQLTLDRLAELIRTTSASEKAKLPWLKLARFGNAATAKGSLRHDRNLIAQTGIEADYDGEVVSFEAAVEIAEKAGLSAIIYTSPSHTAALPRWRILCPTSTELPAAQRPHMLGRLNGLYRGIFAVESWTLSQSYYFGSINGNPEHRVEIVDGMAIDELHELDLIAIGKPATRPVGNGHDHAIGGVVDEAALLELILSGEAYHTPAMRLLGLWARGGVSMMEAQHRLEGAFDGVFPPDRDERWRNRRGSIPEMLSHIWGKEAEKRDQQAAATPEPNGHDATGVSLGDFYAYMPTHAYIFTPCRAMWPAGSVNARIAPILDKGRSGKEEVIKASTWLDRYQSVEQMTWAPGMPMIIEDKLIIDGGWIDRSGMKCFNLYQPPQLVGGDPKKADIWVDHIHYIYPDDANHIIDWLAHRAQLPHEKINHALVLGGYQGIGKDTLLEPVKHAVGPWNFQEVGPTQILGRFNGFLKSVILRVSEARDIGEFDRFQLYDHMKAYTAAPPDVLRIDEKFLREYSISNCCGVIVTTNHKTDGIYLPADDRRHYVAWSDRTKDDPKFQGGLYWEHIWGWYYTGGLAHVAAFLRQRDISHFNPKAPPLKTEAFWTIVNSSRTAEHGELADALDLLGNPDAVTLSQAAARATSEFAEWLLERKNRRVIPHRFEDCGYVPVRNPDDKRDGQWRINGRRQTVYAKAELGFHDQIAAIRKLVT